MEIIALAPPAEAHARIAFALAEVRKYLIPDNNDNIRQEQMREMESSVGGEHSLADERRSVSGPPRSSGVHRSSGGRSLPPSGGMSRSSRGLSIYIYSLIFNCLQNTIDLIYLLEQM